MITILKNVLAVLDDFRLGRAASSMINLMSRRDYAHGLTWFGVPIFQSPTDLYLYQEIVFRAKPTVIIETGVAKGGSVLFACQLLDLLHKENSEVNWQVVCADINSLADAQRVIMNSGYSDRVKFFQGDSASLEFKTFTQTVLASINQPKVLLMLDSNHTEKHVLEELHSLGDFVSESSYVVVWDSRIGDLSWLTHLIRPRAWNKRHHAGTGVALYMEERGAKNGYIIDKTLETKLKVTGVKNGILFRTKK